MVSRSSIVFGARVHCFVVWSIVFSPNQRRPCKSCDIAQTIPGPRTTRLTLTMRLLSTKLIIAILRPSSLGRLQKLLTLTITHARSQSVSHSFKQTLAFTLPAFLLYIPSHLLFLYFFKYSFYIVVFFLTVKDNRTVVESF